MLFRGIQKFRLGREGQKNPFDDDPDIAGQPHLFIYLTGRGEYSYLFRNMSENDIILEAEQTIPMGYTQIWVLERVIAIRPDFGEKNRAAQRRAAQDLGGDRVQEGRSYVLIGEDGFCFGSTEKRHTATEAARVLAVERKVRIVIGRLKANVAWH